MTEPTHRVIVDPSGIEFTATHGEILMAEANRAGLFWPTVCGGLARCGRCAFVARGADVDSFSSPTNDEEERLKLLPGAPDGVRRLACPARVCGDVTIVKKFVRGARPGDNMPYS